MNPYAMRFEPSLGGLRTNTGANQGTSDDLGKASIADSPAVEGTWEGAVVSPCA
jgi:hypothetical protein